jgi:hypothetical protein
VWVDSGFQCINVSPPGPDPVAYFKLGIITSQKTNFHDKYIILPCKVDKGHKAHQKYEGSYIAIIRLISLPLSINSHQQDLPFSRRIIWQVLGPGGLHDGKQHFIVMLHPHHIYRHQASCSHLISTRWLHCDGSNQVSNPPIKCLQGHQWCKTIILPSATQRPPR